MNGNHIQSVVQVLSKVGGGDFLFEVLVGGCNHSHIHLNRPGATDTLKLSLLEETEELHLKFLAHFANFIQENRPPIG